MNHLARLRMRQEVYFITWAAVSKIITDCLRDECLGYLQIELDHCKQYIQLQIY